jgi:hypothetical protein
MKKIFVLMFFAVFAFLKQSGATTKIINNSGCDMCVWIVCWQSPCPPPAPQCCIRSETPYFVKAGTSLTVPDCGGCTSYILHIAPPNSTGPNDCYRATGSGIQIANQALNNCGGQSACLNNIQPTAQICGVTASANVPGQVLIQ